MSLATDLMPEFVRRLSKPEVETVLLAGCGGGFDFVHGLLLYPTLLQLGKRVVLGSYSFGDPKAIGEPAEVVFRNGDVVARRVSAESVPPEGYCPEVHVCAFLDERYPSASPHRIYAYYARDFTVPLLHGFYAQLIERHDVDAVVLIDGGSDSLVRGDEEGLGDPVEDCVSLTAVSRLGGLEERLLVVAGFGCDRFNHVSDAASLRAVAELTEAGGFLGGLLLHAGCAAFDFYRDGIEFLDGRQRFRSVVAASILSAGEGRFGWAAAPRLRPSGRKADVFLWPLMAGLWAFEIESVVRRSMISSWIRDQTCVAACYDAIRCGREALGALRPIEDLPRHLESRFDA